MKFYTLLKKSCKSFFDNAKFDVINILIDIGFFVLMANIYTKIWEKMFIHMQAVVDLMGIEFAELAEVQSEAQLSSLAANQGQFMVHYQQISNYVLLILLSLLVFWIIFQGINWFRTQNLLGKKTDFKTYMARFSIISLLAWLVFMIISFFSMKTSFYASQSLFPSIGGFAENILTIILLFLLFYLVYIAYTLIPRYRLKDLLKNLIPIAYHGYKKLLPAYLFMALVLLGEYLVFMRAFYFGGYAAAVFAIVIIFPTLSWTRFYAIKALE